MEWLIFTSQFPASPSRLRVMVWRRMKAAGAVGLQNGVWVLPRGREQEKFLNELLAYLAEQGADGQSFAATALDEKVEQDLVDKFRGQRDEEYAELIESCQDLLAELEKESGNDKFTFAELEENETDLQKLENWLKRIRSRDLVGGERAEEAGASLETCRLALHAYAERVYEREHVGGEDRSSE